MGYIGQRPPQNAFSSPGLWTPNSAAVQQYRGLWDAGADPYWAYTKLLIQPSATDSSIVDRSSAARSLTVSAGVALSGTSRFPGGASINFDGASSHYVVTPTSTDFDVSATSTSYVLEVIIWIPPADGSDRFLLSLATAAKNYVTIYRLSTGTHPIIFNAYNGSFSDQITGTSGTGGTTHYVAAVQNGTTMRLYVDGVLQGTANRTAGLSSVNTCTIGNLTTSDASVASYPATMLGNIYAARVTVGSDRGYTGSTIPLPTGPWPTR